MMRPKDVTGQLGISAATLRLWSNHFASVLSPAAQPSLTEKGTPAQRRYEIEDVEVFLRAKSLLDLGLTYEQVAEKLAEAPSTALVLPAVSQVTTAPQNGHQEPAALGDLVTLLTRQNELSEQILAALTARPPIATEQPTLLTLLRAKLGF